MTKKHADLVGATFVAADGTALTVVGTASWSDEWVLLDHGDWALSAVAASTVRESLGV